MRRLITYNSEGCTDNNTPEYKRGRGDWPGGLEENRIEKLPLAGGWAESVARLVARIHHCEQPIS